MKMITFNTAPYKLQFAVDRQWEKAWKLNLASIESDDDQIKSFLGKNPQIVAGELFYKTVSGDDFFFGIQFDPQLKGVRTSHEFVKSYIDTVKQSKDKGFGQMIKQLSYCFNRGYDSFSFDKPTEIVLGVVDYWVSEGPCVLWTDKEKTLPNQDTVISKLADHQNLLSNKKNYIGLEFVYERFIPKYWACYQVSTRRGESYQLDVKKVISNPGGYELVKRNSIKSGR